MILFRSRLERFQRTYEGPPFTITFWDGDRMGFGAGAPRFDVHFKTRASLALSYLQSNLGFGEAYVRGDVVIDGDLEEALIAIGKGDDHLDDDGPASKLKGMIGRTLSREKQDIEHHYGRGEDFYELYLDRKLQYSCGYFRTPEDTLDQAQEQKIAHTARKLHLRPGQRLLDIGCGWGHLMFHAAETYGVECVGLTLCDNQAEYIRREARARKLPVTVRVQNYLELPASERWERVVSVGMMCHIGEARIDAFYDKVTSALAPGAICLLHCIAKMQESSVVDPFVEKHVFPGYWFNSMEGMSKRAVARGLHVLDVENLRQHYALTTHHWRKNFLRNYDAIKAKTGYDDRFMRTWEYYLASATAGFRRGRLHLLQMVMSNGVVDDYPMTRDFLYSEARRPVERLVTAPVTAAASAAAVGPS